MPEPKPSRVRDPRSLRYHQAKQAGARLQAAERALMMAEHRRRGASERLTEVVNSGESKEERAYLLTVAGYQMHKDAEGSPYYMVKSGPVPEDQG